MYDSYPKQLIIMRGCPGSGKSTLAYKLCPWFKGVVLGSDQYFEDEDGNYNFEAEKLGKAHEWNRERVMHSMEIGIPSIYVDNTNSMCWEMSEYLKLAQKYNYKVSFKVADTPWAFSPEELFKNNTHNVPLNVIKKMVNRFEHQGDLTDEEFIEKILNSKKK